MTGIINIDDKEIVFNFDNFELTLYDKNINWFDYKNCSISVPYKTNKLEGITLNDNKKIIFFTDNIIKTSIVAGTEKYGSIKLKVNYYVIHTEKEDLQINKVNFYSKKLDNFYNVGKLIEKRTFIENKFKHENETKKQFDLLLDDKKVILQFLVTQKIKLNTPELNKLFSVMSFIFEDEINIDELYKYYFLYMQFIQYISYDIYIGDCNITILKKARDDKGNILENKFSEIGKVYFKNYHEKDIQKEYIIKYDNIENGIVKLMEELYRQNIYLEHLSNTIDKIFGYYKYGYVLQCFEEQYARLGYNQVLNKSEVTVTVESEIVNFIDLEILNKEKYNKKHRKKYRKWRKRLLGLEHKPLEIKIDEIIKKHESVMNKIRDYVYFRSNKNYATIIPRIVHNRNKYSHGEVQSVKNEYLILDYYFMLYLCYVMVLSNIGLCDEKLKVCIEDINLENSTNFMIF